MHIPPGGDSSKGIGCFALFWNGFMCIFTPPWFFVAGEGDGPPMLFLIPFLMLFWAIGLGMAYAWMRMRFTRTYLLLEPQHMAIQTQWGRSKKMEEAPLTSESRAQLVESYQMNDIPVHRIDIAGEGHTFKFGTRLSEPEKEWLANAINQFLNADSATVPDEIPNFCWNCGASLADLDINTLESDGQGIRCPGCGEPIRKAPSVPSREALLVPSISSRDVPQDSEIHIEEDTPDRLAFSLPLLPEGKLRHGISTVVSIVGLIWVGISGTLLFNALFPLPQRGFDWFNLAFRIAPLLPGIAVLWLGLTFSRGKIRVSIDREWFRVRYQSGFIRKGKRFATSAIEAVRLQTPDEFKHTRAKGHSVSIPGATEILTASVYCGESFLPLTTLHDREIAQLVAGLVKERLIEFDVQLTDAD